jgi:hypothetical protein
MKLNKGLQGATAIAFDKTQQTLYAVTNGGIYVPPLWVLWKQMLFVSIWIKQF